MTQVLQLKGQYRHDQSRFFNRAWNRCPTCSFTLGQLTCIHAKLFPTVTRRTCMYTFCGIILEIRTLTLADMPFLPRLGDPGQKALQTTIEPTRFVDFCLIPLSNTCSLVQPARNMSREIFLHFFCVGKFGLWSTRPCWIIGHYVSTSDGPDFVTKDRHCSKSSQLKTQNVNEKTFYFGVLA